jgi:thioredoxin-related protein
VTLRLNIYIYGSNFFCIFYVVWLSIISETMHTPQKDNIEIFTENKSAISLGKKSIFL